MRRVRGISGVLTGVCLLLAGASAQAEQWQIVGPRALGMGGAHVAVVNDATAQYWNPAAFGFFGRQAGETVKKDEHSDRDFGMDIHAGLGFQAHEDIIKEVDDVTRLDFDILSADIQSGGLTTLGNVDDFVKIIGELEDLNKDKIGITAMINGGANIRLRNWAIGGMGFLEIAAIPQLDLVNINPGNPGTVTDIKTELVNLQNLPGVNNTNEAFTSAQTTTLQTDLIALGWTTAEADAFLFALDDALVAANYDAVSNPVPQGYVDAAVEVGTLANNAGNGGSFDNNTSNILFRGALVSEIPLTYGRAFSDSLSVGGNIKAIKARTYYTTVDIFNGADTGDFFGNAKDDYKESSNFGVDLGVLYKMGVMRLGLVGRNLNKPSFDYAGTGDYELDPQVRAGTALRLWNWITLAADLDLIENDTNISGNYKSRNLGVGAEFDLLRFLRLRAGAYRNLSEGDVGLVYTAGLGVNLYLFQLDAGVARSKDTANVDGSELPEEVRGELALSFQF